MSLKLAKRLIVVVIVATVTGVSGAAFASSGSSSTRLDRAHMTRLGTRLRAQTEPLPAAVVRGARRPLPKALVRSFLIFRKAAETRRLGAAIDAGPAFPGAPAAVVSQWGLAVGDLTATTIAGFQIWVIPGSSGTCMFVKDPVWAREPDAGDCVPNGMAIAGDLSPMLIGQGQETVIGLAPNGNSCVTLTTGTGTSVSAQVSSNVYVAQATRLQTATLKNASGTVRTIYVPDGAPQGQ